MYYVFASLFVLMIVVGSMNRKYVLDLLQHKKRIDPECKAFGSSYHQYNLLPSIDEDQLALLEKEFEILLPEDYKRFILAVGNGGAGPGYGLYSVQGALGEYDETYRSSMRHARGRINQDFDPESEDFDDYGMLILCQHGCANDDFLIVSGSERSSVWTYIEWAGCHVPLLKEMPDLAYINTLPENQKAVAEEEWLRKLFNADFKQRMSFEDWYCNWLKSAPSVK